MFDVEEFKLWLRDQALAISEQYDTLGADRYRLEGKWQACDQILLKIETMIAGDEVSETDAEEAAAESVT